MGRYGPHYSLTSVVSSVSDDSGRGMGRYGARYRTALADTKGEGMGIYDRNIGTGIWAWAGSADRIFLSSILLSELRPLAPLRFPLQKMAAVLVPTPSG